MGAHLCFFLGKITFWTIYSLRVTFTFIYKEFIREFP
jgi:hypothetical protein